MVFMLVGGISHLGVKLRRSAVQKIKNLQEGDTSVDVIRWLVIFILLRGQPGKCPVAAYPGPGKCLATRSGRIATRTGFQTGLVFKGTVLRKWLFSGNDWVFRQKWNLFVLCVLRGFSAGSVYNPDCFSDDFDVLWTAVGLFYL